MLWQRRHRSVDTSRPTRLDDRDPNIGSLLEFSGQQIESGLTRIETANNWTLTIVFAAVIAISGAESFPDPRSLILLCGTFGLTSHFMVRAMKGYTNVVRYAILSRTASAYLVADKAGRAALLEDLRSAVLRYQQNWRLPISRRQVWAKALTEFSFAYIYLGLIGMVLYTSFRVAGSTELRLICLMLLSVGPMELALFNFRSPYMKQGPLDPSAVALR